jgi:hypothetical protein
MEDLLDANFNPEHYHPEAVERVRASDLGLLDTSALVLRMIIELRAHDLAALQTTIAKIVLNRPAGYEMYQLITARMIIAYWKNDKAEFTRLTDLWLDGRRAHPGNWSTAVLGVKEFKPWLSEIEPSKFDVEFQAPPEITAEQRALIKDEKGYLRKALRENLEHIRAINIKLSVASLA